MNELALFTQAALYNEMVSEETIVQRMRSAGERLIEASGEGSEGT